MTQGTTNILSYSVVQWLCSLLLAFIIVIGAVLLITAVADWNYIRLNPVAAYEDDLGYGLVVTGILFVCAVISLPVGGLLAWRIKKIIARKVNKLRLP